jgi:predicted nucleic acid-binding Zn ribbon protein
VKYQYKDPDGYMCDIEFPMGDAPEVVVIDSTVLRRSFTVPGVVFKGGGWASKS